MGSRRGIGRSACIAAFVVAASCQPAVGPSPSGPSVATPPGPATSPTIAATGPAASGTASAGGDTVAAVRAFDGSEAGFARLHDALDGGGDPVPALAALLKDADPTVRFAAIYLVALLTDTPAEIDVLRRALDDPAPELRAMAAASLAGRGVVEALPVLIDLLDSDAQLPYSRPPTPVADQAWAALNLLTAQAFTTAGEWRAWWAAASPGLRWDGSAYVAG